MKIFALLAVGTMLCGTVPGAFGQARPARSAATMPQARPAPQAAATPLATGKFITPLGRHTNAGSFPCNAVLSPDGKYIVITNTGFRQYLTVVRVADNRAISRIDFNGSAAEGSREKDGLYYGLAFGPTRNGKTPLYAALGKLDRADVFTLDADGTLTDTGNSLHNGGNSQLTPLFAAGLATDSTGKLLYIANNQAYSTSHQNSSLSIVDTASDKVAANVTLPGFPYAVAALTQGAQADKKIYAACERDGLIAVIDTASRTMIRAVKTGLQPDALLLDKAQNRLFAANGGSDTISIIDTRTDRVTRTILLRPDDVRGLPGATPTGLALAPDEKKLYVTLADMNAVAVIGLPEGRLLGYLPVGWYPTAAVVAPDGKTLFVTSAKGVQAQNPNGKAVGANGQYIENILEGTVSAIPVPTDDALQKQTAQVIANNRITPTLEKDARALLGSPGIQHVIYIIKENRTYDNVLGDLTGGNGDKSLCMFPREVTPNQHALAERFVLLDNFYCCAEVSADGWDWSTSGMASEYSARNTPFNYSGRGREYDFEGQVNGVATDLFGIPDVARAPGGYFWDLCAKKGLSYRNYGFYLNFSITLEAGVPNPNRRYAENVRENYPTKRALVGHSDVNFRQFDMNYPDSELGQRNQVTSAGQRREYGKFKLPNRYAEWKREFDGYVKKGDLPRFEMVRFPCDHTSGTRVGALSPQAMVADNDYAVGQLVEAVSKSPYWKSTAIFILEDDAQNGYDHVDAHRSIAFVISPWTKKSSVDSRFYNTDSMLRTMGLLLGLPPLCQYDAVASPMAVFGPAPDNDAPYTALMPDKAIAAKVNTARDYRAFDSARLLNPLREESAPDEELNDILWVSIMGRDVPAPTVQHGLSASPHTNPTHDNDDDK